MASLVTDRSMRVERAERSRHDWGLLASAALLILTGLLTINSVSEQQGANYASRQMIFLALGIPIFYVCNRVPLELWRKAANPLYVINILMLLATRFAGKSRGVAERWIEIGPMQFQPSEVSKILLAITLAAYYAKRQDELNKPRVFAGAILHALPIIGLVFLQPHLGAAIVLLCAGFAAGLYAGVPSRFFAVATAGVVALGALVWFTPGLLKDYHRERAAGYVGWIKGTSDVSAEGYHQMQAKVAIGSGGVLGTGYMRGEQIKAKSVPEQQNDFIFSAIGEEGGLIGSLLVLGLFGFFFTRVTMVVYRCKTMMGRVVSGTLFATLALHTVINLAMVLQVGPVIGLWLPFLSAGGTALWMCMGAVGLMDQCE